MDVYSILENTINRTNVGLMMAHPLRRWSHISPKLGQRPMSGGMALSTDMYISFNTTTQIKQIIMDNNFISCS